MGLRFIGYALMSWITRLLATLLFHARLVLWLRFKGMGIN